MVDTYVDVVDGEKILVQLGDGGSPETFAHDCMINAERGFTRTASTITKSVPNCTDPSKPDKTTRVPDSTDSTIAGQGKVHSASVLAWLGRVGKITNVRVRQAGVWRVAGPYIVTSFAVTGTARNHATASIAMEQADEPTYTADTV